MHTQRVEVIRSPPRNRDIIQHLAGKLYITILSQSYLHVGSGKELKIDRSKISGIVKRMKEDPYYIKSELQKQFHQLLEFSSTGGVLVIPGSTVKGNVRSRLELSFKNTNGKVNSCFMRASIIRAEPSKGMQGWRHYNIWRETILENRGPQCDYTQSNAVCLICDLFGTNGLKGLVEFSDFVQDRNRSMVEILDLPYNMRVEAVTKDSLFKGVVTFFNITPEELGLILLGMGIKERKTGRPVLLGRLKYRRDLEGKTFGRVVYSVDRIELSRYSKPLFFDQSIIIEPGSSLSGELLDSVINRLTILAMKRYPDLKMIDEVEALEKLT